MWSPSKIDEYRKLDNQHDSFSIMKVKRDPKFIGLSLKELVKLGHARQMKKELFVDAESAANRAEELNLKHKDVFHFPAAVLFSLIGTISSEDFVEGLRVAKARALKRGTLKPLYPDRVIKTKDIHPFKPSESVSTEEMY